MAGRLHEVEEDDVNIAAAQVQARRVAAKGSDLCVRDCVPGDILYVEKSPAPHLPLLWIVKQQG